MTASRTRLSLVGLSLAVGCCALVAAAGPATSEKTAAAVWAGVAEGRPQDLTVVFDDAKIEAKAVQGNRARGVQFDDDETRRFKAKAYAASKRAALAALPTGQFAVLKDYKALPLMQLRIRSAAALKALLDQPLVLRADRDDKENLLQGRPRP